jgi:hypothetical protein
MRKKALKILEWCIINYGASLYYSFLPRIIIKNIEKSEFCGTFNEINGIIEVHTCNIKNDKDLIITIIHEYVHYTQCPETYNIVEFYHSGVYEKNPLEIWAEKIAQRDWKKCKSELQL